MGFLNTSIESQKIHTKLDKMDRRRGIARYLTNHAQFNDREANQNKKRLKVR
jgi:hypothetical protein